MFLLDSQRVEMGAMLLFTNFAKKSLISELKKTD